MRGTKLLHSYAVNPPPDESDLRPIDRALLPEQLSEKGQTGFYVQGRDDFQNLILRETDLPLVRASAAYFLLPGGNHLPILHPTRRHEAAMNMQWPKLLSAERLGSKRAAGSEPQRSPFQRDWDRIVFSSAFRRLQDKTQVFPLADNDYVRTRLTHSLEVASVARSLGTIVGTAIGERGDLPGFHASDFGAVVSAAALAHDLGNPPFGHSGEDAIRVWFENSKVAQDARTAMLKNEQGGPGALRRQRPGLPAHHPAADAGQSRPAVDLRDPGRFYEVSH